MNRIPELHDAIQDLSEALDRRLVVLDRTMRVVAYSIHESPEDRLRLSRILAHSDSWDTPATAHQDSAIQVVDGVGSVVMYRLLGADRHIVGHLMLSMAEGPDAAPEVDLVTGNRLGRISRLMEVRDSNARSLLDRSSSLAVDLVALEDERRQGAAATLLGEEIFGASEHYCAVAIGPGVLDATPTDLGRVEQAVAQTIRFVNDTSTASVIGGVTIEGTGVLIFPRPVVAPRLARILSRPQLAPARAGIGPLAPLDALHDSYRRAGWALRATSLAPADHPVAVHFSDTGSDGVLATFPLDGLGVADLPTPVRNILLQKKTRPWAATLEAFLENAGDIQRTAQVLKVHRSTIYYRLDRLTEVAGVDLRLGRVQRDLHLGLRLARLAGFLEQPVVSGR
ncbi:PucR family transcriptional regulator [Paeniglutamicibacter sp. MACA_103]|uniref:PucR family transcriptional regulator n=1 Tax=Paeniglutamicibacter sp. MACA_103 TaxID=3377337 RepID=UPI003893F8B0